MSVRPRRRLEIEDVGDITVMTFYDRKILDEQNIQIIGEQLFSIVDDLGRKKIILNFSNVEYLSSAAVGKIITLDNKIKNLKGSLILCNLNQEIYDFFESTLLNRRFKIVDD